MMSSLVHQGCQRVPACRLFPAPALQGRPQAIADPFIMKNIFPEEAARKAEELGVTFPE